MPSEPKPDNVKIIQIAAGTATEADGVNPYTMQATRNGCPVEIYGLGDDGEVYWRNDRAWWRA
jgi:hypothetical protein